jgi:opacity protein-like surface antigen
MKKIILSSVVGLCLLTPTANAVESDFFVKANLAYSKLDKAKGLKSKKDVAFGVGLGYNYLENVRLDLTFDHFINPKFASGNKSIKGNVNSLLLNGIVDIVDISIAKIFIGAGAGVGQTQATVSGDTIVANNGKAKQEYSVAYALYLGSAMEFAPGIFAELSYSYRYIGETKKLNNSDIKFKGQHLSVGLRFDL